MIAKRIYDAIVVGAGPAGSRTARDLAIQGFDVLLLEEHRQVGLPCHCSGLVTARTLALASVDPSIILNTIRGATVHLGSGRSFSIGGDRVHAYVVDRPRLDRQLAEQAVAAGVELRFGSRFVHYRLEGSATAGLDGLLVATVREDNVEHELRARLLVGADGARSPVARQVRGGKEHGTLLGLGAQARYSANPRPDHVELFVDDWAVPGWFGWTIPVAGGMSRIGTAGNETLRPMASMARLRQRFPDSLGQAEIISHTGGGIALWEPTPLLADRVLLVGDAARQVKPTSGGGIYAALNAAALAAATATAAFHQADLSARGLAAYERRWTATDGQEMRRSHDLRRAFTKLSDSQFGQLAEAIATSAGLTADVDRVGDIDAPSRIAWAIARRNPRLALGLATLPRFPRAWLRRAQMVNLATIGGLVPLLDVAA
jgi:digeranylgeranylglycerophospholipid reductase